MSEDFFKRARESRARLAKESGLIDEPEKYARLRAEALEIQHENVESFLSAENVQAFGRILDDIGRRVELLFPNDSYGQVARRYLLKRAFEKARDEIGDWLQTQNRSGLAIELTQAMETWETAEEAAHYIEQNILSEFPGQDLFTPARNAKVAEAEAYYARSKTES